MSGTSRFGLIGVLMGGYSSEREISLRSGHGVVAALAKAGHQVMPIDIIVEDKPKIAEQIRQAGIDVAFIALHGRLGEDGVIQSMLEEMGIVYTGAGVQASQKAFNKVITQRVLKAKGFFVPDHVSITDGRVLDFKEVFAVLKKLPFVVKAACEGSSIGITIVRHPSEWEGALKDALFFGPQVIIEKFIKGMELTVGVLKGEPLSVVEIRTRAAFFDFTAKYQQGFTDYVVPAQIPADLTAHIQKTALAACDALGCESFARVDIRLDENNIPYILEINTVPGFTETSLFPKAAGQAGYSFVDVCEQLLDMAYGKKI